MAFLSRASRRASAQAWLMAVALLATAAIPLQSQAGEAQAAEVTQQQVEAAYLYKFGSYVTWPDTAFAGPGSPVVIGVAGADALAAALENLVAGHTIAGRPVAVRRIQAAEQLAGVQMLFIGNTASAEAGSLFEASRGRPILVVTEGGNGLDLGGAISFVVIDARVRFDVSLTAVQKNGLKLSALLLSVAHQVSGASQ
jgi:YfiR/HmsC-like